MIPYDLVDAESESRIVEILNLDFISFWGTVFGYGEYEILSYCSVFCNCTRALFVLEGEFYLHFNTLIISTVVVSIQDRNICI